jgi:hypothetical protein
MPSMLQALGNAGLVSEKVLHERTAQEQLNEDERMRALTKKVVDGQLAERDRRLEIMDRTTSIETFRFEARKLLINEPGLIQHVINIVHDRDLKEKPKGGVLLAHLLQLRTALSSVEDADEKSATVKRVFTKR